MSDEKLFKKKIYEKIYEQYWLHARHQENQRLWFTNIYAMIVTGVFTYFSAKRFDVIILMFLLLLSLLGYFLIYTWNISFTIFSRLAEEIAIREWELPEDYRRFTKYRRGYEFSRIISVNTIFIGFYSLMIGILTGLLIQNVFNIYTQITLVITIIVFLTFLSCYKFYLKPKSIDKIQKCFDERIKKYDQQNQKCHHIALSKES